MHATDAPERCVHVCIPAPERCVHVCKGACGARAGRPRAHTVRGYECALGTSVCGYSCARERNTPSSRGGYAQHALLARRVRYTFTLHATHSLLGALLTFSCPCPLSSHHHCRHRQAHQPASATASASVPPPSLDKSPWLLRFRAEKILIFFFGA